MFEYTALKQSRVKYEPKWIQDERNIFTESPLDWFTRRRVNNELNNSEGLMKILNTTFNTHNIFAVQWFA